MTRQLVEIATFGLIGVAATLVHLVAAILLIEQAHLAAWLANIFAFAAAFPVSYAGHAVLTFSARRYGRARPMTLQSLKRFLVTAIGGFALNQTSVVLFISVLGLPHRPVLLATVIGVAGLLFLVSKFWAFTDTQAARSAERLDAAKPVD